MKKALVLIICFFSLLFPFQINGQQIHEKTISKDISKKLDSVLSDWFSFYNIRLSDFTLEDTTDWEITEDIKSLEAVNEESFFVVKLSEKDLIYDPLLREYSPGKHYYIPLYEHIVYYHAETGEYYSAFDDSQNIWLYNTKTGWGYMIQFWGVGGIAEAVYWLDDKTVVIVSKDYSEGLSFYLYDLDKMQRSYFSSSESVDFSKMFYRYELSKRGVDLVE